MSVKNRVEVYLVGFTSQNILGRKLPTIEQVLCLFFHNYKVLNLPIGESYSRTIKEIQQLWTRAQIPTQRNDNCIRKLKKIYEVWIKLFKNRSNKKSPAQMSKESVFTSDLKKIFDISCQNVLEKLKSNDIKHFYISQNNSSRRGLIDSISTVKDAEIVNDKDDELREFVSTSSEPSIEKIVEETY